MRFQKNNPMRLFCGALFLAFVVLGFSACNKEITPGERFSLTKFNGSVKMVHADTSVTFSWEPALTAWEGDNVEPPKYSYEITIAKDYEFADPEAITSVQDSLTFTIGKERLTPLTQYYARVRVLGGPNVGSSLWENYSSSTGDRAFRVLLEINYFKPIKVGDIIDVAARLRWVANSNVTHLVLSSEDSEFSKRITLSEDEKKNGVALMDGLPAGQEYRAELYLLDEIKNVSYRRGTQTLHTKPDVSGAGYTDLRAFSEPTILQTTLNTVPAGSIIVLKRGMTYTISSSVLLDRDVTIMSEPGFGPQALIQMTSSLGVKAESEINLLKFEDVEIKGTGSTYVFNLTAASTLQKIEFEACRISDHTGVCRLQGAGRKILKDYVINNSIVQNIGVYGMLQGDHVDVIVDNIHLTNSTFINAEWIVRWNASVRTDLASMVIESSTFFRAPHNNRFILDVARTGSTIGRFTANNTLFGYTEGGRSFNSRTPSSISSTNSFATSDVTWGTSSTQGLPAAGIVRSLLSSEQIFVAPDKVNFSNSDLTIKDAAMSTVGDPRWRP